MLLLMCALVCGLVSVSSGQRTLPARCAAVSCLRPSCLNPYTPPGQCCPTCREKRGRCPRVRPMFGICVEQCSGDYSCPGRLKCCSNGCGHVCRRPSFRRGVDCSLVRCARVFCRGQFTPPGRCCPVCPRRWHFFD